MSNRLRRQCFMTTLSQAAKEASPENIEVLFSEDFSTMGRLLKSLKRYEVIFVDLDEHTMRSWHGVARHNGLRIRSKVCKAISARAIMVV